jgi:AAA domain
MKMESFNPADLDYFPPGEPWPNGPDARAQKHFELIPFDKIAFDTTPGYLVKSIVPRIGLCVFWGPPKCGKSFLVFDMLMHVALNWKYRGRRVQSGPVVYCAFEGQAGLRNRVEAFRQCKLAEGAGDVPFYLIADAMNLVADHPALIASVRAALGDTTRAAICLALHSAVGTSCPRNPPHASNRRAVAASIAFVRACGVSFPFSAARLAAGSDCGVHSLQQTCYVSC